MGGGRCPQNKKQSRRSKACKAQLSDEGIGASAARAAAMAKEKSAEERRERGAGKRSLVGVTRSEREGRQEPGAPRRGSRRRGARPSLRRSAERGRGRTAMGVWRPRRRTR